MFMKSMSTLHDSVQDKMTHIMYDIIDNFAHEFYVRRECMDIFCNECKSDVMSYLLI